MTLEIIMQWTFGLLLFCAALFFTVFMVLMMAISLATIREKYLEFRMERQRRKCKEKLYANEK
jgi:Ni/Fe-hydrogenase subunit HybB-like protein